jgi:hypothetical protein
MGDVTVKSIRRFRIVALAVCSLAAMAQPAQAFGLRTHLYIAEQVLTDAKDCAITLVDKERPIPQEVCDALEAHPGAFMAGAIGPDAFPDIVIGQSYIHPGAENGRQSADWFDLLLQQAKSPEEIAFAYGNLVHASADMFAHSYVNNYSGGVFEILAARDKDIENRHFTLEKYIDQRLDYGIDPDLLAKMEVPEDFVVSTLVETNYFSDSLELKPGDWLKALKDPGGEIGKRVFGYFSGAKAASHAVLMRSAIELARAAEQDTLCEAARAEAQLAFAHQRYLAAEAAARGLAGAGATFAVPSDIQVPECDVAHREGGLAALIDRVAAHLEEQAERSEIFASAGDAIERRGEFWKHLDRKLRSDLDRAWDNYQRAAEHREETHAVHEFAKVWGEDVKRASGAYIEAGLQTALLMVENSRPYPPALHERTSGTFHYDLWSECYLPVYFGQPFSAGEAKCERLRQMGTTMELSTAAMRAGMGNMPRNFAYRVLDFNRRIDQFFLRLAKEAGRMVSRSTVELLDQIYHPARVSREKLDAAFEDESNGQLEFVCVSDWIDMDLGMLAKPPGLGVLRDAPCRTTGGPAGTPAPRLRDTLDPEKFVPLVHAATMAKLSLLGKDHIEDLAVDLAGEAAREMVLTISDKGRRYSVILDTPRSLDGSYQWQGESMPYPRQDHYSGRERADGRERALGSGFPLENTLGTVRFDGSWTNSKRKGFPFYQSRALRERAFTALFPGPFEGTILRRAEMQPDRYPFRPCEGDPFRPHSADAPFRLCLDNETLTRR